MLAQRYSASVQAEYSVPVVGLSTWLSKHLGRGGGGGDAVIWLYSPTIWICLIQERYGGSIRPEHSLSSRWINVQTIGANDGEDGMNRHN